MIDYTEQIKNGVKWLDENSPGWEHKIDLDTLDVNQPCRCILGQTSGYWETLEAQVAPEFGESTLAVMLKRENWSEEHGFKGDDIQDLFYPDLTDQWKVMVEKCRARESKDAVL